ncbi:MAG: sugar ABC transporter permease [Anaerolineae bacterium]|nr:sugar ABC transporter permease [Anaerolineae bacterium]
MTAPAPPTRAKTTQQRRWQESLRAWVYIAPAGLIMLFITLLPQGYQIWMAFTDFRVQNLRFNILSPATWQDYAPPWIWFDNFVRIITSDMPIENYYFGRLLLFNVVWTISNVAFHVTLGVIIAMVLNGKYVLGRRFYRALYVIPWAMPPLIAAVTWHNMYDYRFGAVNLLLAQFNQVLGTSLPTDIRWMLEGTPPIGGLLQFLPLAYYCTLVANIWLGWPFMSVVATGALQAIPSEMYEAAEVDGASPWQRFWKITLPLIRPAMVPAIMLGSIWTFNQFNVIYFISQGGPLGRTEILVTQAYKLVLNHRLYGMAAAFSIVVFLILLVFTLVNNRVTQATEAYDVA